MKNLILLLIAVLLIGYMGCANDIYYLMSKDSDLLSATELFEQGHYELTEEKLQNFMLKYQDYNWPDSIYYLFGQTYYELEDYYLSRYFLDNIMLLDNNESLFYDAQLIIGQGYYIESKFLKAMDYFLLIIDNSNNVELLNNTENLMAMCKDSYNVEEEIQRKKGNQLHAEKPLNKSNSISLNSYISEFTWTKVDSFVGNDGWQYHQWLIGIEFRNEDVERLSHLGENGWMEIYKKIYILLNYDTKSAPWFDQKRFPYFTTRWAPTAFYLTIGSCEHRFVLVPPDESNGNQWEFYVDGIRKHLFSFKKYYNKCLE